MVLELKVNKDKPYVCQYCGHGYTRQSTLATHVCEQKRRHLAKDEKHVMVGYQAFVRFYQTMQNAKGNKTYAEFAKSPVYNAFVKFGSYVTNVNPLYPDQYINWVVTSGVKIDHWCKDELYEKYVLELIRTEPVEVALQRSVIHMQSWSETNNDEWSNYFRKVSANRAMFDIKDGKISPWLVLNCASGKTMLNTFNDEQLISTAAIIDPQFWLKKFKSQKDDLELVKQVVKEAAL